jgi:hypothetical protein
MAVFNARSACARVAPHLAAERELGALCAKPAPDVPARRRRAARIGLAPLAELAARSAQA